MEKLNQSQTPMSEETRTLLKCSSEINLYKSSGGKGIRDPMQLVLLDIRGTSQQDYYQHARVFKSEWFDINSYMDSYYTLKNANQVSPSKDAGVQQLAQAQGDSRTQFEENKYQATNYGSFNIESKVYPHLNPEELKEKQERINGQIKQYISMKYLFVIGNSSDFDNEAFRIFLKSILEMEGKKPFQMFLYKFNMEILQAEFPYLLIEGTAKKHLSLYPYRFMKCSDLKLQQTKDNFELLVGYNMAIKGEQLQAINVQRIVVIDNLEEKNNSGKDYIQQFSKYKQQNLDLIPNCNIQLLFKEYNQVNLALQQVINSQSQQEMEDNKVTLENNFDAFCKQVSQVIEESVKKDQKLLFLGSDLDSLIGAAIVNYLMQNPYNQLTYSQASQFIKERLLSFDPIPQIHNILKFKQLRIDKLKSKNEQLVQLNQKQDKASLSLQNQIILAKTQQTNANCVNNQRAQNNNPSSSYLSPNRGNEDTNNTYELNGGSNRMTFKEQVEECIDQFYKELSADPDKFRNAVLMVQRFQKNIIDNPSEVKYKQIRPQNLKIREAITKFYHGKRLLNIIGFQDYYEQTSKETVLRLPNNLSVTYLKGQKLDFDLVVNQKLRMLS